MNILLEISSILSFRIKLNGVYTWQDLYSEREADYLYPYYTLLGLVQRNVI